MIDDGIASSEAFQVLGYGDHAVDTFHQLLRGLRKPPGAQDELAVLDPKPEATRVLYELTQLRGAQRLEKRGRWTDTA